jgi:hypothetical protein
MLGGIVETPPPSIYRSPRSKASSGPERAAKGRAMSVVGPGTDEISVLHRGSTVATTFD